MKSKTIICEGKVFQSILELSSHYKIHQSTIARRLRDGWTAEQSVGVAPKPKRIGHGISVTYNGKFYPHIEALAIELGIDGETFRARLKRGYSIEDAAVGKMRVRESAVAKNIEFEGVEYKSQTALANAYGQKWSNVTRRVNRGWTMRQALGLDPEPPRFRNFEGHARNVKWKTTRQTPSGIEPIPDAEGYKIYLITNEVNGKQYVGLTIGPLVSRLKQHIASAKKGRKAPLPNAIRKYGAEAFTIKLIRSDAKNFAELQQQEIDEIAQRKTLTLGYNSAIGGAVGITKSIEVEGKRFPSQAQAAEFYGVDVAVFNLRITRLKWTPEEAAGLVNRDWGGKDVPISVEGITYSSIRQAAIAYGKDFRKIYDRYSEKGWTIEQALDLVKPPDTVKYQGKSVTVFGVTYPSIAQAAQAHKINSESLRSRIASGMSPDDAMTLAINRKRKTKAIE